MEFINTSDYIYHPSSVKYLEAIMEGKDVSLITNILSQLPKIDPSRQVHKSKVILPWHIKKVLADDEELAEVFFVTDHVELPITIIRENFKSMNRMATYEFVRGFVLLSSSLDIEVRVMGCPIDYHLFDYEELANNYVTLSDIVGNHGREKYYFDSFDFLHGLFVAQSYSGTTPLFKIHSTIYSPTDLDALLLDISRTITWEHKYKQLIGIICKVR